MISFFITQRNNGIEYSLENLRNGLKEISVPFSEKRIPIDSIPDNTSVILLDDVYAIGHVPRISGVPIYSIFHHKYRTIDFSHERFKKIVCVSKHSLEKAKEAFPEEKLVMIYNGINTDLFRNDATSMERKRRKTIFIPNEQKNPELVKKIRTYRKGREYEIVTTSGKLNINRLLDYYKRADVTLSIGIEEGFNLVLVESLAMGVPVVARDGGPFNEIITDEIGRMFTDSSNLDEIFQCIEEAISIEDKFKMRQRAVEFFDYRNMASNYVDLLSLDI